MFVLIMMNYSMWHKVNNISTSSDEKTVKCLLNQILQVNSI